MTRFFAALTTKGWRIYRSENGVDTDICGAISAIVAWETCRLLMERAKP